MIPVRDGGVAGRIRLQLSNSPGDRYFEPAHSDILAEQMSFTAPVDWSTVPNARMRDGLSSSVPIDLPRYDGQGVKHRTMSDVLASQRDSSKEESMTKAWEWFAKREFARARAGFRNAEIVDKADPETRVGQFFCSLADGKFSMAGHDVTRIIALDLEKDMFIRDFGIAERFAGMDKDEETGGLAPVTLEGRIDEFSHVLQNSDFDNAMLAALTFAFWHSESSILRLEALQTAELLRRQDTAGEYGRVCDLLQQAYEQQSAGGG
jgi:hypothetical protein